MTTIEDELETVETYSSLNSIKIGNIQWHVYQIDRCLDNIAEKVGYDNEYIPTSKSYYTSPDDTDLGKVKTNNAQLHELEYEIQNIREKVNKILAHVNE